MRGDDQTREGGLSKDKIFSPKFMELFAYKPRYKTTYK